MWRCIYRDMSVCLCVMRANVMPIKYSYLHGTTVCLHLVGYLGGTMPMNYQLIAAGLR